MKHLLGGVAIAALVATGVPAWAQSSTTQSKHAAQTETQAGTSATGSGTSAPSATYNDQSGATTSSESTGKTGKHTGAARSLKTQRGGASREDNMAEELNREELQRVTQGGGETTGSGQTQAPAGQSGATGPGPAGSSH